MTVKSSKIVLKSDFSPTIFLFKSIGGDPKSLVPLITRAFGGYRKHIKNNTLRLAPLIIGSPSSLGRSATFQLFLDEESIPRHDWVYEIYLSRKTYIVVKQVDPDGFEHPVYDGLLDNYIVKMARKRRPPGRTPSRFFNRPEFELDVTQRQAEVSDYRDEKIDLRGVRVFTKEEYRARASARRPRKLRRE